MEEDGDTGARVRGVEEVSPRNDSTLNQARVGLVTVAMTDDKALAVQGIEKNKSRAKTA